MKCTYYDTRKGCGCPFRVEFPKLLPLAVKTVFLDEDEEATPGVAAEAVEPGVLILEAAAEAGDPVEDPLVDESGPGGNGEGMITRRGCSGILTAKLERAEPTLGGGEKAASTLDTYELGLPKSASEAMGTLTVHLGEMVEVAPNKEKLFTPAAAATAAAIELDSSQP